MNRYKLLILFSGLASLVALGCLTEARSSPEALQLDRRSPPAVTFPADRRAHETLAQAAAAYRTKLSIIANNLANTETVAFKRARVSLEDLPYRHRRMPGTEDTAGQYAAMGISIGMGVRVAGVQTDFCQGAFVQTERDLDLAIEGSGFFQVTDPSGDVLYTRAGNFSKDANGSIVTGSASTGRLLQPAITIPTDATSITIGAEGQVSVRQPGSTALSTVGQIELARFVNPQGLLKLGENLYAETDASGPPALGNPGGKAFGRLRQGALEASNVEPEQEQAEWTRTTAALRHIRRLLESD